MTGRSDRSGVDPDAYLARFGIQPSSLGERKRESLARLQRAHVRSVPFETLAVTGDPHGDRGPEGVSLDLEHLYRKVVERRRGGYCYELNGLFGWLLDEFGYGPTRIAGRILGDDGRARPPANHHPNLVTLDGEPHLVDVGLGTPTLREPLPLDGTVVTDDAGVAWKVVGTERPDADGLTQYRYPDTGEWADRYLFDTTPRALSYFAATNEFLSTAPESPFTGDPVVSRATDRGHLKLTPSRFVRYVDGEPRAERIEPADWYDLLRTEFGLDYP
jgi:N-hydroxyarylamine O-acetyltransferase